MGQNEPRGALLRRGMVMDWLGLSDQEMTNLVKSQAIRPRVLREGSRAFYVKSEIKELFELKTEEDE